MTDCFNGKLLNKQKLLNSDFIDRFFGFIEEYDNIRKTDSLNSVTKWIDNEDYSYIRHFLHLSPKESMVQLSVYEFIYLTTSDFLELQNSYSKLAALFDEQKSLYQEFLSFYEQLI